MATAATLTTALTLFVPSAALLWAWVYLAVRTKSADRQTVVLSIISTSAKVFLAIAFWVFVAQPMLHTFDVEQLNSLLSAYL